MTGSARRNSLAESSGVARRPGRDRSATRSSAQSRRRLPGHSTCSAPGPGRFHPPRRCRRQEERRVDPLRRSPGPGGPSATLRGRTLRVRGRLPPSEEPDAAWRLSASRSRPTLGGRLNSYVTVAPGPRLPNVLAPESATLGDTLPPRPTTCAGTSPGVRVGPPTAASRGTTRAARSSGCASLPSTRRGGPPSRLPQ